MKGICWLGLGIASFQAFLINPCFAQSSNIIPDNSLGAESSQVTDNFQGLPVEVINGGAQRGINLFHSFTEFNISEGRGAYFFSPNAEIQNILTRVTGRNPSEILGTLGTFGNSQPNFFLINPNGIVFGENASLDVGGSFVASTANGINLGEMGFFSATEPTTSNLLSVNPSALFFNAVANQQTNSIESQAFLTVSNDKSLLLVGGNISPNAESTGNIVLNGGRLRASGGRIEIGGLGEVGKVDLNNTDNQLSLGFPEDTERVDISLLNTAEIDVTAGGGGDISIYARNLDILEGSDICAGIGADEACGGLNSDNGSANAQAGDITLNAKENITIANPVSEVYNDVNLGAIGNSGDINITAKSVEINDDGTISASTFGKGNSGSVNITTDSLVVSNGAHIQSFVIGEGNSGNIKINASESIEVTGTVDSNNSSLTRITSQVGEDSTGISGDLLLNTKRLTVKDGGQIQASTFSEVSTATSGTINVNASESIEISGTNGDTIPSRLFTGTYGGAYGSNLNINTEKLSILNGGVVSASTAAWLGEGRGGNLSVNARDSVEVSGFSQNGNNIFLSILAAETGRLFNQNSGINPAPGGNLTINTGKLNISNNGRVSTETYMSAGRGGDLTVNTTDMDIVGSNSRLSSRTNGQGDAGNLKIRTQKLAIREGAEVSSSSSLENEALQIRKGGNAGIVDVDAAESVELTGLFSGLVSFSLFSTGDAGKIKLNTGRLLIRDGAVVSTNSLGTGKGGDIEINAADFIEISGSGSYFASDISPVLAKETGLEQVTYESNLSALTGTKEDAGNITINTGRLFLKDGGEITANTNDEGKGGNINIQVDSAFLANNASINASSGIRQIDPQKKFGDAGNISINTRDNLTATNSTISTISKQSSGGAIDITAKDIRLFGDSNIVTNVFSGEGGGGNINLTANTIIALDDSDILSFALDGKGGDISFNTAGFFSEALYRQTSATDANALSLLDGNNRTDINASGAVSGAITGVPVTFIDEELTDLPENQIDTNALIANSCISRSTKRQENSFKITGSGALRNSPGDGFISEYSTGDVRNVEANSRAWKKGDRIIEPQGLYQLPDGRLLLSRDC